MFTKRQKILLVALCVVAVFVGTRLPHYMPWGW